MALAYLGSAIYLFNQNSKYWGWLVLLSVLSTVIPTNNPNKPDQPESDTNLTEEIKKATNDRGN